MELNGNWKWTLAWRSRFASTDSHLGVKKKANLRFTSVLLFYPYGDRFLGMRVMHQKIERKCQHRLCSITPHYFVMESMWKIICGAGLQKLLHPCATIIVPGSITCSVAISRGLNKLLCRKGSIPLKDIIKAFMSYLGTNSVSNAHTWVLSNTKQPNFTFSVLLSSNS